jgi:cytochrome c556
LDPAHEALLLREHFTELLRLDAVQSESAEFRRYLTESEAAAKELEDNLRAASPTDKISATFARITQACAHCHKHFRDVPLGEKRQ